MSIDANTFDSKLDLARVHYLAIRDRLIDEELPIESHFEAYDTGDDTYIPKADPIHIIRQTTERLATIDQSQKLHLFLKLTKEQRDAIMAGRDVHRVIGTTKYKVTAYDTPHSIAERFGVSWQDIATYNDISMTEIEPLQEIVIPVANDELSNSESYQNNPVYNAHIGIAALGRDVRNNMRVNPSTGDVEVLDETNTFQQGLRNLLRTNPGELPGDNNYGFDSDIGDDIDEDARDTMLAFKIQQAFDNEPRIEELISINVNQNIERNGWDVTAIIRPINSLDASEFTDIIDLE